MQAGTHRLIDASKKLITPKELERVTGNEKLSERDTKISVQNVSFAYPLIKDVTDMSLVEAMDRNGEIRRTESVLKNMSVEFDKGGLTAVVGTSGNGKSTLMSLIRHDYDVQEGKIFIGDKEIRELSDRELNAQITFVDQKVHFFDDTVGYNLKYFKPGATEEELMEACKSFESYFVQKMIEEAKKTVENEDEEGEYTKMFADMRNEQLADTVTESGQIGLAQQLYDNLKQQYKL